MKKLTLAFPLTFLLSGCSLFGSGGTPPARTMAEAPSPQFRALSGSITSGLPVAGSR